jgi:rhomboid family GlyGly-CTERM serine protease
MVRRKELNTPGAAPVLSIVVLAIVVYKVPRLSELLVYDRRAILDGELWRLLTAPMVHFSASHLFWDAVVFSAAGLAAAVYRLPGLWPVCGFGTLIPGVIYLLGAPGLERYGGLSGPATGAVTYYCLCMAGRPGSRRMVWLALAAGTGIKILVEAVTNVPVFAQVENIPFRVLPSAHFAGFSGALVMAVRYWRGKSATVINRRDRQDA